MASRERVTKDTCPLHTFVEEANVNFLVHVNLSMAETDAFAEAFDTLGDGIVFREFDVFTMNRMKL